jgi:hypothetical protein
LASRLLAAKTPQIEAARRRDAVARWRNAIADGLTAEQAARAVGVTRATLYRWEKPEPESRRPHHLRKRQWTLEMARAVEELRNDNPMWGKRKIAVLLRREGIEVSISTAGRILAHLVARSAIVAVPVLRRRPQARRIRFTAKERYARRLPKGRKTKSPGELVQIDTLFDNVRPNVAVKHFTAYDPVAKWTIGKVATALRRNPPRVSSTNSSLRRPSRSEASRSMVGASSDPSLSRNAKRAISSSSFCRPDDPTSTAASSAPNRRGDTSSMPLTTCLTASISSRPISTLSPTDLTTTGHTTPLPDARQPSISNLSAPAILIRLICAEPGHPIAETHLLHYYFDEPPKVGGQWSL